MNEGKNNSDFNKFLGKWVLETDEGKTSIEFKKDGTIKGFYKPSLLESLLKFSQTDYHPFLINTRTQTGPTWILKNGFLKILMSTKEQKYRYSFSENNKILTLTKKDTGGKLSFKKTKPETEKLSKFSFYISSFTIFTILYFAVIYIIFTVASSYNLETFTIIEILLIPTLIMFIIFYFIMKFLSSKKFKS